MRPLGLVLILAAVLWPLYWFAPLAATRDAGALFSQYLGSVALVLMGINQFIATRMWGIETVFGSLDRIYVLHKWLGITAIVALGLHDIIDAEMDGLRGGALSDIAEDIGEISFYGLLILGFASIITFIPYHLWKWTHRFIGVFFALGAFHFFFIEKPFQNADPLGLYVSVFCILGLVSYAYMIVLRPLLPTGHAYVVDAIRQLGDITEVMLRPTGRGLRHTAGQFAFLSLNGQSLAEEHPFTLSGSPAEDRGLRFSIKDLGDYTHRLGRDLSVGTEAVVSGPYGHFTMPAGRDPQIWVGAGVGITPFLAFTESLKDKVTGPVTLYYCVRGAMDVPYTSELQAFAAELPHFSLVIVPSGQGTRLTADRILQDFGSEIGRAHTFFCGPKAMRQALKTGLVSRGLKASRFHFEEFEMRSGIGLRKLAGWLFNTTFEIVERRRAAKAEAAE